MLDFFFAIEDLSIKASTASCNILFSFLNITSNASFSINCFNLLFRTIICLYNSLRSTVVTVPSTTTRGLKSAGITGKTLNIIHSGLLHRLPSKLTKFLTTFNFLI